MGKCDTCGRKKYGYLCEGCIHDPDATDKYEPMNNADRIRAMSDEELADLLTSANKGAITDICRKMHYEHNLQWLKQPVEEE